MGDDTVDLDVRRAELMARGAQGRGDVGEEHDEAIDAAAVQAAVVGGVGVIATPHQFPIVAISAVHLAGQDVGSFRSRDEGGEIDAHSKRPAS